MFDWIFPSASFRGVDSIYLLTRLGALLVPPGTATLTVQFSNRRFVIYVPLIVIAAVIISVVAGSGCATITIIEVAAVQRTRGAVRFVIIIIIAIVAANAAYIA